MVETLIQWARVRERAPFDATAYNRLINWFNGQLAAPMAWVDDTGALMMSENPTIPKITFFAPVEFVDTVTISGTFRLFNTIYLYSRNAADSADIGLIRLNASDIIELGPGAAQRLTIVSPLTNALPLNARNAANSANVALLMLDASDIIQLGAAGNRLTFQSPLANNTGIFSRNAANSANVALIGMNASDQIVLGAVGTSMFPLGTMVAPTIDPPTIQGQVTAASQCQAWGYASIAAGVVTLGQNYNVASVVRNVAGDYTVNIDHDFSAATYAAIVTVQDNAAVLTARVNGQAAGSFDIHFRDATPALADPDGFSFACFGTLV